MLRSKFTRIKEYYQMHFKLGRKPDSFSNTKETARKQYIPSQQFVSNPSADKPEALDEDVAYDDEETDMLLELLNAYKKEFLELANCYNKALQEEELRKHSHGDTDRLDRIRQTIAEVNMALKRRV